ncbi:MAG: sigma-70 family RNA polymerase sigma factor [Bacteroidetes bacterium]|nr:sigma-70 family RNA polymerase sigma factor [Bacteroidota bacterium]
MLVEKLKQRNRGSFNELYDHYSSTLYGVICRVVNDPATAEDVLQETFVKVWKNIGHYSEDKGTFFTWLLNITRYTAIDYLRSRQHKQKLKNRDTTDDEYVREQVYLQSAVEYTGLKGLVAKLEPKYREVIDLLYFWGYTQEEVARILNIPLGTVKTRARTGLQILRNQL